MSDFDTILSDFDTVVIEQVGDAESQMLETINDVSPMRLGAMTGWGRRSYRSVGGCLPHPVVPFL